MIYLKNTTEPQEIHIPRNNQDKEIQLKKCRLQNKTVLFSGEEMLVLPDPGYDGIKSLVIKFQN